MTLHPRRGSLVLLVLTSLLTAVLIVPLQPSPARSQSTVPNPLCPGEDVFFNPGSGEDIILDSQFKVSVFAKGLNFPTGLTFRGDKDSFEVFVLESGHGLPSRCNDQSAFGTGDFDPKNPFTPDILVSTRKGS